MNHPRTGSILVAGAGPAGLACAYELSNQGVPVSVIEKNTQVGGLCRTLEFQGCLFDIGGHRFLSKSNEINNLWKSILGPDLLRVGRKSRIYYQGKYFDYPLEPLNSLRALGAWEALRCCFSYFSAKAWPGPDEHNFEGWMTRRFGRRLYEIFFKTYTEKVWGVPCSELSSDWAIQRIQGLSLGQAIRNAFSRKNAGTGGSHKTLSSEFYYPSRGPGLFCDKLKETAETKGARFLTGWGLREVRVKDQRIDSVLLRSQNGTEQELPVGYLFSSVPLPLLVRSIVPHVPEAVEAACRRLRFRSFMVVNLIFDEEALFPDHWIYIHSSETKVGRIQNYKNWSSRMVPEPRLTSLGMEYFVTEGDDLWNLPDREMIEFALREIEQIGIAPRRKFTGGFVVRVPNVYPVYGVDYQRSIQTIRSFLDRFENLQTMGRSGLFRYDNSDHALLTGLYAARNYFGAGHDVWQINTDRVYAESL